MKPQLIIFAILIAGFIAYNFFFQSQDDKNNTAVNIIFASILLDILHLWPILFKKMKK
jgi:hypothetical protein